jgi:hypothetical protein
MAKRIKTTPEVGRAICQAHKDTLMLYGSFSNPDGGFMGFSGRGEMMSQYSFDGIVPFIELRTTWEIETPEQIERVNEVHEYWLFVPSAEDFDRG